MVKIIIIVIVTLVHSATWRECLMRSGSRAFCDVRHALGVSTSETGDLRLGRYRIDDTRKFVRVIYFSVQRLVSSAHFFGKQVD